MIRWLNEIDRPAAAPDAHRLADMIAQFFFWFYKLLFWSHNFYCDFYTNCCAQSALIASATAFQSGLLRFSLSHRLSNLNVERTPISMSHFAIEQWVNYVKFFFSWNFHSFLPIFSLFLLVYSTTNGDCTVAKSTEQQKNTKKKQKQNENVLWPLICYVNVSRRD